MTDSVGWLILQQCLKFCPSGISFLWRLEAKSWYLRFLYSFRVMWLIGLQTQGHGGKHSFLSKNKNLFKNKWKSFKPASKTIFPTFLSVMWILCLQFLPSSCSGENESQNTEDDGAERKETVSLSSWHRPNYTPSPDLLVKTTLHLFKLLNHEVFVT